MKNMRMNARLLRALRHALPLTGVVMLLLAQACTTGAGSFQEAAATVSSLPVSTSPAVSMPSAASLSAASPEAASSSAASPAALSVDPFSTNPSSQPAPDLAAIIAKALDEITSSPLESSNTEDYIEAHPDAVQTVMALGDEALPLLAAIYDNGDRGLRGAVAISLCMRIHTGLNRVVSVSPDGRFRAETFGIRIDITSGGMYPADGIRLVEHDGNRLLWSMEPGYYRTVFLWSADSRYVAIYYEARIYGTLVVLDTKTMTAIELPTMEVLQQATKQDISQRDFRPDPYLEPGRWLDDGRLEVAFTWVGQKEQDIVGRFVFRVADGTVESLAIN